MTDFATAKYDIERFLNLEMEEESHEKEKNKNERRVVVVHGAFHRKSIQWDAPFFFSLPATCTQHRKAGRRSADANLMFEGIGSNSQQVERSELSGHRHCLPICEKQL